MDQIELKDKEIIRTIETLYRRINDRFPNSGLSQTCNQLHNLARGSEGIIAWINKTNYAMRFLVVLIIGLVLFVLVYSVRQLKLDTPQWTLAEFVSMTEAALNEVVVIGAGIIFLVTYETRQKRKRVIKAVNRLRCMAHIVDAHQLTKDPDRLLKVSTLTQHSPKHSLNSYELGRYLDYCSEILALISKVGFLYVQHFDDPVANNAVNDLESLTTGIARKIWQKIMILRTQPTGESTTRPEGIIK
ncbi:MAG: hypothetical protein JW860_07960 [Sedimentisphaerales bacterium]|nr:hypothetical protein [Sedimentisphaerales bacterium]